MTSSGCGALAHNLFFECWSGGFPGGGVAKLPSHREAVTVQRPVGDRKNLSAGADEQGGPSSANYEKSGSGSGIRASEGGEEGSI
jgi:hypothetical protein